MRLCKEPHYRLINEDGRAGREYTGRTICNAPITKREITVKICAECQTEDPHHHSSAACAAGGQVRYVDVIRLGHFCENGHRAPINVEPGDV